ncbi:MAG: hypothetical protein RG741_07775 [Bacteroidales bacterium]|nr:hypothetical protein [Bacteroidales bacterium]
MSEHYIDNRFREELKGLEANPPVEAWLAIADELDKSARKRRGLQFFRIAAAITALVAASFSFWFLSNSPLETITLAEQAVPDPMASMNTSLGLETTDVAGLLLSDAREYTALNTGLPARTAPVQTSLLTPRGFSAHIQANKEPHVPENRMMPPVTLLYANETIVDNRNITGQIVTLLSQNTLPATRISLGAHVAPQYSFRLHMNDAGPLAHQIPFQSLEEQILTYNTGISAYYAVSSRFSIQSGINYVNTGQYVRDIFSYANPVNIPLFETNTKTGVFYHPQTILTSQGSIVFSDQYHYYADVQSFRVITDKQYLEHAGTQTLRRANEGLTQVFRFLEVPLVARYQVFQSAFGVELKGGVAGHYLLSNDVFLGTDITQNPVGETFGVNKFNLSVIGGLSMNVPLTARVSFHMEPTAQLFLQPVATQGVLTGNAYPYSFSLQTGFTYGF